MCSHVGALYLERGTKFLARSPLEEKVPCEDHTLMIPCEGSVPHKEWLLSNFEVHDFILLPTVKTKESEVQAPYKGSLWGVFFLRREVYPIFLTLLYVLK